MLDHLNEAARLRCAVKVALALGAESHCAVLACKNSVILAEARAASREHLGAALAHDNLSNADLLAVGALHAEIFRI